MIRVDTLPTPWNGKEPWMQVPCKTLSSPPCMQTESSQARPCRKALERTGGWTKSDSTLQCWSQYSPGGGRRRRGHEGQPLARQVAYLFLEIPCPLKWNGLLNMRGDYLKMTHVVSSWYGADGAPYCKDFHGNIHHRREDLVRNASQAGKEPMHYGVQANW